MDLGKSNVQVLKKYENLVNYKPVNETFDNVTASLLEVLISIEKTLECKNIDDVE